VVGRWGLCFLDQLGYVNCEIGVTLETFTFFFYNKS
jgi:hypothetical protein